MSAVPVLDEQLQKELYVASENMQLASLLLLVSYQETFLATCIL